MRRGAAGWRLAREGMGEPDDPWDRLPLQAALLQGFGCDGHTVLLAHRPEWLLHPEGNAFGRWTPVHHFYWHAECEVAIRARIAEDEAKGASVWHWYRALHAIRTDSQGKKKIDVRDYVMDREWIDGWFDYRTIYEAAADMVPDGGKLVEVGGWHGRSVLFLADAVAARGKTVQIKVVDLFEDLGQHIPGEWSKEWRSRFEGNHGFAGGRCCPVQADSVQAAECEADESLDFVFIDADKHYNSVMADLQAWWPKLKPGGILAGHDYVDPGWPGVTSAVHDWAFGAGVKVHYAPPHAFWVQRPDGQRDQAPHATPSASIFRMRRQPVVLSTREEHAYNPGMERDPETGKLVFAYRTTGPGWGHGKIWLCEIDPETAHILTGPVVANLHPEGFSYEDPRLFIFNGRLWLQYTRTSFRRRVTNRIGVCPLGRGSRGLWQVLEPCVLFSSPNKAKQEKNWVFFEHQGRLKSIYSMDPWVIREHRVETSASKTRTTCTKLWWDYGIPRGGSQPFRAPNGCLWAFFHSSCNWRGGWRYFAGLVEIHPETLTPIRQTVQPLLFETPGEPGWVGYHVVWPAGAVVLGDEVFVACGRNDHTCFMARLPLAELDAALVPVLGV